VIVRARKRPRYIMNTKLDLSRHFTKESKGQLKLVLYAVASALLPYAVATLLILVGPSL
jgi:hypothetical protein